MAATEPGTLLYAVPGCATDPNSLRLYELYANESAFQAHLAKPPTRSLVDSLDQWLSTPPRVMASPLLCLRHQLVNVLPRFG
ncbi:MAG: hypothetical protein CL858_27955 [Cupriavidus sp.]|jgi:quinol monooxygenase YgiN|uniref:antibiotic biosynthesis monooxygenase n=1 Tax=Cupriavidus TaxID=106589 RepID=UPI000C39622F|nr:hypothetical protein [Cupriavidus sp.]